MPATPDIVRRPQKYWRRFFCRVRYLRLRDEYRRELEDERRRQAEEHAREEEERKAREVSWNAAEGCHNPTAAWRVPGVASANPCLFLQRAVAARQKAAEEAATGVGGSPVQAAAELPSPPVPAPRMSAEAAARLSLFRQATIDAAQDEVVGRMRGIKFTDVRVALARFSRRFADGAQLFCFVSRREAPSHS